MMKVLVILSVLLAIAVASPQRFRSNYQAPAAPYAPSGWRPAKAFLLPARQSQSEGYHYPAPDQEYGPPTTTEEPTSTTTEASTTTTDATTTTEEPTTEADPDAEGANYEFQYDVNEPDSGSTFGHRETRTRGAATGVYYVLLPNGQLQRVSYRAGENGYVAEVQFQDAEPIPAPPAPVPIYGSPLIRAPLIRIFKK